MTDESTRVPALASRTEELAALGAREVTLAAQVDVRVDAAGARELGLPTEANTWSRLDDREALWLGPDEWLIVSASEPAQTIGRALDERLGGRHRSVVDVSANRVVVALTGDDRRALLEAGCGLDLHPRSWRSGMCAQTLLASVAVLLQEREDGTRVFVRPSFAGWLVTWLMTVAAGG